MEDGVLVVLPAYNEEDIIADTIDSLTEVFDRRQILVVNDGSTDDTLRIAEEKGVMAISLDVNSGKGRAMNTAWQTVPSDIYLFVDADLGKSAGKMSQLLPPVLEGFADMSIADIPAPRRHKGGFGLVKLLANRALARYAGYTTGCPLSGQRAIRRSLIEDIGGFEDGYGIELDLTISALCKNYKLIEVPIRNVTHRFTGRDLAGFKHRGRQFLHLLKTIYKCRSKWMRYRNEG